MSIRILAVSLLLVFALLLMVGCSGVGASTPTPITSDPVLSEKALRGETVFNANCALCHGINAAGTSQGPTLIDRIYHPGHHADLSFRFAVGQGVRQHHWTFGDMPPVPNVSTEEVEEIICYVRELQLAGGIFQQEDYPLDC